MQVMTVLGPVDADAIGLTSPHEHLLVDASMWWRPPQEPSRRSLAFGPVELRNRGAIFRNQWINRDNMVLDDEATAIDEVLRFKAAGGRTIVDLTSIGIGRDPLALARISRLTGLNVICGSGFYVEDAHPPELRDMSIDGIAERIVAEFRTGLGTSGVRPGIIGEVGTSPRSRKRKRRSCERRHERRSGSSAA